MSPERTTSPYGIWQVESNPTIIEYAHSVMGEVAAFANDGLQRLSRGGIEVGGVLYGTRSGTSLRIEAWRPIPCEHSKGPSFTLSTKDEAALTALLAHSESDPELKGYEVLGWFHSHTRSEICLTDEDLQIYDRYFAELWQAALVLKPKTRDSVRAGFFVRELGGRLRTGSSLREFSIKPSLHVPAMPARTEPVKSEEPTPEAFPAPVVRERRVRSPFTSKWLIVVAVILMIATVVRIRSMSQTEEKPEFLPVKVSDQFGSLQMEWDHEFKAVKEADSAQIVIIDGKEAIKKTIDKATLRSGMFHYVRTNEDVTLEMTLLHGEKVLAKEISRFVGPKSQRGKDALMERASNQIQEITTENMRLQQALKKETARTQRLERTVRSLQERLKQ